MKRLILPAVLLLSLTACGETPEETDQRQDRACQHYGAKPGTPEYIQCRATIHVAEVTKQQADSSAMASSVAMGVAIGASSSSGRR